MTAVPQESSYENRKAVNSDIYRLLAPVWISCFDPPTNGFDLWSPLKFAILGWSRNKDGLQSHFIHESAQNVEKKW